MRVLLATAGDTMPGNMNEAATSVVLSLTRIAREFDFSAVALRERSTSLHGPFGQGDVSFASVEPFFALSTSRAASDTLFALLLVLCIGLPAVDLIWRWRRGRHPVRRSPSRRDWARIRAAEQRAARLRESARQVRDRSAAEVRARRADVRRRLDVIADQWRQSAVVADTAVDRPEPGWTRVLSGTLP
ncbi:hypothetical protein FHR81_001126 [Actinoalloteichus hoggarensis]|uniref:Uncharacterized protein n=1 Tax=Actinoalloteichus hoggarensis TaxID=1470176 RepID=A0A221VZX4_9PSEU|nr:hypothetical protein [Actinoalloteichus hoggarensis]ASO18861.1 hypothetical protein AHOG_06045 [Actinoalloteichus hoggarensis]MBB5920096.1 hypothetical protein [Actinoalloteichus hoggarensis]